MGIPLHVYGANLMVVGTNSKIGKCEGIGMIKAEKALQRFMKKAERKVAVFTEDLEDHYREDVGNAHENCLLMVYGLEKEFDKFERKLLSDIRKKCKRQVSVLVERANKEEAEEIRGVGFKKEEREDLEKRVKTQQMKMREEFDKRAEEEMRTIEEKF